MEPLSPPVDLAPHLVYRADGDSARCALWRLESGQQAVALFTSAEAAGAYRDLLPDGWSVMQPQREALAELFALSCRKGVRFAVLDPDGAAAKRIFDLNQVVDRVQQGS